MKNRLVRAGAYYTLLQKPHPLYEKLFLEIIFYGLPQKFQEHVKSWITNTQPLEYRISTANRKGLPKKWRGDTNIQPLC